MCSFPDSTSSIVSVSSVWIHSLDFFFFFLTTLLGLSSFSDITSSTMCLSFVWIHSLDIFFFWQHKLCLLLIFFDNISLITRFALHSFCIYQRKPAIYSFSIWRHSPAIPWKRGFEEPVLLKIAWASRLLGSGRQAGRRGSSAWTCLLLLDGPSRLLLQVEELLWSAVDNARWKWGMREPVYQCAWGIFLFSSLLEIIRLSARIYLFCLSVYMDIIN